jgi:hypothetical protein
MAASGGRAILMVASTGVDYYSARRSPHNLVIAWVGSVRNGALTGSQWWRGSEPPSPGGKNGYRFEPTRRLECGFHKVASVTRSIGRPDRAWRDHPDWKRDVSCNHRWL